MADTTISSLPLGTPAESSIIPFSQNNQTYSTTLAQLSSLPFIPKAWVNFNGQGTLNTNQTIRSSYNIDRVVKISVPGGNSTCAFTYQIYFKTPMPDANYVVIANGYTDVCQRTINAQPQSGSYTTTSIKIDGVLNNDASVWDSLIIQAVFFR